jgi:hypothetical protein
MPVYRIEVEVTETQTNWYNKDYLVQAANEEEARERFYNGECEEDTELGVYGAIGDDDSDEDIIGISLEGEEEAEKEETGRMDEEILNQLEA